MVLLLSERGRDLDVPRLAGMVERAPELARIHRYVAIDVARRDYPVRDAGIAPSRVTILPNAVDLALRTALSRVARP